MKHLFSKARYASALLLLLGALNGSLAAPATPTPTAAPTDASAKAAHAMLQRLCDDFGGRVAGSVANRGAMEQLAAELRALGLKPEFVPFKMPGWERGDDRVEMLAPVARPLRVAAIGYTQPHPAFEAGVVEVVDGKPDSLPDSAIGQIGLVSPLPSASTRELIKLSAKRGLRGLLLINREDGGQLLARIGSFVGEPLPLPVYSLTLEEGRWIQRLLARNKPVRVRMETRSHCLPVETANLVVRLPGRSPDRIILGAHFDSWDLGQGATDNGLGTAQLFALAHAWRGRDLPRTLEFVWFNAEEMGVRGSRFQASQLGDAPVVVMINLDMVGVPIGVNALGDDSLLPALERWHATLPAKLAKGIENAAWFGSDHLSYQLVGVRAITFNGPIDRAAVRFYHDFGDTIDKLPEKTVVDSTAIIGDAVLALVNDAELKPWRRAPADTEKILVKFGIDKRLQAIGWRTTP